MKIRVGIIGTGSIAQLMHIPYIRENEGYELVTACDPCSGLVEKVGELFKIPRTYSHYEEMLQKENLDAVVVCSPDECHEAACIESLEMGCHVLVEKPLALSVKAADRIVRKAEKANLKLMVAYMKRYDPGYETGVAIMQEMEDIFFIKVHDCPNSITENARGSIGAMLKQVTKQGAPSCEQINEAKKESERQIYEQLGDPIELKTAAWRNLLGLGTHDMTILRGAFGDPTGIIATTIVPGVKSKSKPETEYTTKILSMLDYGKTKCVFEIGGTQRTWFDEEMIAYGNKQTTTVQWPFPWLRNEPTVVFTKTMKNGGFEETRFTVSYEEAFNLEHQHFLKCIETNIEPRTNGKEGKKDMEILYQILQKAYS